MDGMIDHGRNAPVPPAPLTPGEITAWLDFALESLIARRAEILDALAKTAAAHPRIDDDETLADVAENVKMAKALTGTAEKRRVESKAPFLDGGRAVDSWFARLIAPIGTALKPIQTAMDEYGNRIAAKRRAEAEAAAKAAREEAERRAAEAAALLDAEKKAAPGALDWAFDKAQEAADKADTAAAAATARPADLTRVTGTYGATASLRASWKWRVVDEAKIPRRFLMVNEDAIKAAVADAGRDPVTRKPNAVIPGVEFFEVTSMGVR
jgi:hypothetical protein